MTSATDQFSNKIDYEWAELKSTAYPKDYPAWIEKLKAKVALWLPDEQFVYLGFFKDDLSALDASSMSIFGLTERFVLQINVSKLSGQTVRADTDWKLELRSRPIYLDAEPITTAMRSSWLVITVEFDGFNRVTIPEREDFEYDAAARRALFDGLRHDYYPPKD